MDDATLLRLRRSALFLVLASGATLAVALTFQFWLGYVPCKLCLTERLPYYAAIPLGLLALVLPEERLSRLALGLAALGLLYGAALSVYHAGAEWSLWAGPTDCGGGSGAAPATVTDFRATLETTRVADCSTAAWRYLGVSLAGWNAVMAFILASVSGVSAAKR